MVFQPLADKTRWEGLIVSGWLLLIDLLLLAWVVKRPTDSLRFLLIVLVALSVPVLLHFFYRTWGAFTLEYWVDRNAVTVRFANVRQVIPLQAVRQIAQGGDALLERRQWHQWPAPFVRQLRHTTPPLTLFATQPLANCLLLDTGEAIFALSPAAADEFLDAVQDRYRLGASQPVVAEQVRLSIAERFLGPGRVGPVLLSFGLIGVLILFGLLMVRFPDLPNPLPVRYTRDGLPELVRDKDVLFRLPMIGLWTWVINGFWGMIMVWFRQPTGAYLLWGGTIVVHAFLLMALRGVLV